MAKGRRGQASAEDDLPKAKLNKESFTKGLRLFKYIANERFKFIMGMFFLFGTAAVGLLFPFKSGSLIGYLADDTLTKQQVLDGLDKTILLLIGILVLQAVFSFGRVYMFGQVAENILRGLRNELFEKLIKKPLPFFNKNQSGELSSRLATDVNVIGEAFTVTIAEFVRQVVVGIGGLCAILYYTPWEIAKWFLLMIPPIIAISLIFAKRIRKFSKEYQDKIAEVNGLVTESLTGIVNVKTFTNEQYEIDRFGTRTLDIKKFGIKYGIFRGAFFAFVMVFVFGSIFFILYKMIVLKTEHVISGEDFGRFMMLSFFVAGSLGSLAETISSIQRALGATDRVFELIDEPIEPITVAVAKPIEACNIEFKNIVFNYPSRPDFKVLDNINIKIKSGTTTALVGSSGSGKSTIANLLLRFYNQQQGVISLNSLDIQSLDLTSFRQQIAFVPQEVLLFSGTIQENIAYGKTTASLDEIMEAAQKANALEFIQKFPDQLKTMVGERGIQLSGGQRQRIAIARALLKNPSILILDEATSSLDSESESLVQDALEKLMEGRTSIVIAHRLSTIRSADNIIVMQNGKVLEQGTHEQLIQNLEGLYAKLSKMQSEDIS
jgi:ABC-type multidrug transport system fused ATPase/permease subunit